jgi:hypothetical protein
MYAGICIVYVLVYWEHERSITHFTVAKYAGKFEQKQFLESRAPDSFRCVNIETAYFS